MGLIRQVLERWAVSLGVISKVVPTWVTAFPLPPKEQIRTLLEHGYRREALIYACINEIATSAAEPEIKVGYRRRDGTREEDPTHPLNRLFRHPNPETSGYGLVNRLLIDLEGSGNYFIQKARNAQGATVQLWNVRPDRIRFNVKTDGTIESYEYSFDGMIRQNIPARDMIFDKFYDPLDDFWGLSPITALARYGDLDTETADFLRAYFHNAGAPSGILKFKGKVGKEERERLKNLWREQHSGLQGWHNISVLDADADYQALGGQSERLRLNYIFDATETRICMAFGCPPILVGATIGLNRSTFANYKEARNSFWDETLSPLYRQIGETLSRAFMDEYGDDLVVWFDTSSVPALQEDATVKRAFALEAWNAGLLTRNEARETAGYPPDPTEGDDYKAQNSPIGAPAGGDPLAGLLGFSKNGHAPLELHAKPEREALEALVGDLRQAVRAVLEAPAPTRVDLALDVKTDAGEGLERMAQGLTDLADTLKAQKPPDVKVEVAAPHVEIHAAPAQAKVVALRRDAQGRLDSAVVTPQE